jgi:hypothetical protein
MGYITITGDSDGDLHTAAMHNSKFGAIASVLNGNVDHDNLAYPNSEYVVNSSATYNGSGWVELSGLTSSTPAGLAASNAANRIHCHMGSIVRVPVTMVIKENIRVSLVKSSAFTSGSDPIFYFQKCASLTGTWSQVGDAVTKDCNHGSFAFDEVIITSTSGQSISAGNYIRLVIVNPGANATYPPSSTLNARLSAPHIT